MRPPDAQPLHRPSEEVQIGPHDGLGAASPRFARCVDAVPGAAGGAGVGGSPDARAALDRRFGATEAGLGDWVDEARDLLSEAREMPGLQERVSFFSKRLLGRPYRQNPLERSGGPESLMADFASFDCVTFCETVYSLAFADTVRRFVEVLKALRYHGGAVSWRSRNHYFSDWITRNEAAGFFSTARAAAVPRLQVRRRLVDFGPEAGGVKTLEMVPLSGGPPLSSFLQSSDVVGFGSMRDRLDVYHCGLVDARDGTIYLRHCARSSGVSLEEPLADFLNRNETKGLIVASPLVLS